MILYRCPIPEQLFLLTCDSDMSFLELLFEVLSLAKFLSQRARVSVKITDLANKISELPLARLYDAQLCLYLFCEILIDQICLFC